MIPPLGWKRMDLSFFAADFSLLNLIVKSPRLFIITEAFVFWYNDYVYGADYGVKSD